MGPLPFELIKTLEDQDICFYLGLFIYVRDQFS